MSETLAALHAALTADPTDRTVRLVYADALDESGAPGSAARAEFVRGHVALEALAESDPARAALAARCAELFAAHWIDWWRPVCTAAGLPEPFVPGTRLRDRAKRLVRREPREPGAPYVAHPPAASVRSDEDGFTVQFIAGFPELLYFTVFSPITGPGLFARCTDSFPVTRLRFGYMHDWPALDGPHLGRVTELAFDRLAPDVAAGAAGSQHLGHLTTLRAAPNPPTAEAVRTLVYLPGWSRLRALTLPGVTPPDAIRVLAERCTLEQLDELSFGLAEVGEPPNLGGFSGTIGRIFTEMFSRFTTVNPAPAGPISWPDYWAPLEALARSPVVPRLRTLRIADVGPAAGTITGYLRQLRLPGDPGASEPERPFPDPLVRALADGLNPDRLVRLELPATRVSSASRADLTHRFGPRAVLV